MKAAYVRWCSSPVSQTRWSASPVGMKSLKFHLVRNSRHFYLDWAIETDCDKVNVKNASAITQPENYVPTLSLSVIICTFINYSDLVVLLFCNSDVMSWDLASLGQKTSRRLEDRIRGESSGFFQVSLRCTGLTFCQTIRKRSNLVARISLSAGLSI